MKILLTDLVYLCHNYGAQAILLPFIEKVSELIDAEFSVTVSDLKYFSEDQKFAIDNNFKIFSKPRINLSSVFSLSQYKKLKRYRELIKKNDVIINLTGIEFIGNMPKLLLIKNLLNSIYTQIIAIRYRKKYYKFTKSYGPFKNPLYNKIVERYLNKLPFLQVRGDNNLQEINKLKIKIPVHSFPDISLALEPADEKWANLYLMNLVKDNSKNIIGISPSVVIRNIKNISDKTTGENHVTLCKQLIIKYCNNNNVLLIPHSVGNGKDLNTCDLALARKIYIEMENINNLYILDDIDLTYKQVRAIIGKLDFYITSRYHSVASALTMKIPVVSLSWHVKYRDIMSMYLDDFLIVDCRLRTIQEAIDMIESYFIDRKWFDKVKMIDNQKILEKKIDESIMMIVNDINR